MAQSLLCWWWDHYADSVCAVMENACSLLLRCEKNFPTQACSVSRHPAPAWTPPVMGSSLSFGAELVAGVGVKLRAPKSCLFSDYHPYSPNPQDNGFWSFYLPSLFVGNNLLPLITLLLSSLSTFWAEAQMRPFWDTGQGCVKSLSTLTLHTQPLTMNQKD